MAKIKEIDELEIEDKAATFIKQADMSKATKNKGGRPKKSATEKANKQIIINVTQAEKAKMELAAKELGISVSALCKISLAKFVKRK